MTSWTPDELTRMGDAEVLQIASQRPDGTLRRFITIWVVRSDDDLYVRSAYGYANTWFQRCLTAGQGRVRAGGLERDVTFEVPDPAVDAGVDAAYHAKYDRHGPRIVGTVVVHADDGPHGTGAGSPPRPIVDDTTRSTRR